VQGWGNSTEDTDMFDHGEEKDLDNQVSNTEDSKDTTAAKVDALPEKLDPGHFNGEAENKQASSEPVKSEEKKD